MNSSPRADTRTFAEAPDGTVDARTTPRRPASSAPSRSAYLAILTWSFAFFSTARILAYLPTLWAIQVSGDSSQHSLWTWATWFGSNLTMAVWLFEQGGRRMSRAVFVNLCNALMCGAIAVLIVAHRW